MSNLGHCPIFNVNPLETPIIIDVFTVNYILLIFFNLKGPDYEKTNKF